MSNDEMVKSQPGALAHPASEIGGLIQMALQQGVDVASLERLEAMYERSMERNARAEYNAAMARFHAACPVIDKNKTAKIVGKTGGSFEYGYATLDHMVSVIRPLLAENDLSFSWDMERQPNGPDLCICTIRHISGHFESSRFPVIVETGGRMSAAQSSGSALTFARRYSLTAALGLTTGEPDTDAAAPAGIAPDPMTDEQMSAMLELIRRLGDSFDLDKFLAWAKAPSIDEIPAAMHARVMDMLRKKLDQLADGLP